MSRAISQDQEQDIITALGRSVALLLMAQLWAGDAQRTAQPVVSNTQPIYAAYNDYDEAID